MTKYWNGTCWKERVDSSDTRTTSNVELGVSNNVASTFDVPVVVPVEVVEVPATVVVPAEIVEVPAVVVPVEVVPVVTRTDLQLDDPKLETLGTDGPRVSTDARDTLGDPPTS